jgi:hypothetical protein
MTSGNTTSHYEMYGVGPQNNNTGHGTQNNNIQTGSHSTQNNYYHAKRES